jgi:hypothetical protein
MQKLNHNISFKEKRQLFRQKSEQIALIGNPNIDHYKKNTFCSSTLQLNFLASYSLAEI